MCKPTEPNANRPNHRCIPYTEPIPKTLVSHFTRADATSATTIATTANRPVAMAAQSALIVITEPLYVVVERLQARWRPRLSTRVGSSAESKWALEYGWSPYGAS